MLIYQKICDCMAEIGAIGKGCYNQKQKFAYRGVDDVMNALNPVMVRNKIFCVPEVLEQTREERQSSNGYNLIYSILRIRYTLYAEDGSSISCEVIGEGMDSGDKASNKAMSVAYKYAMFQIFSIPTVEMVDPDSDTPPASKPSASVTVLQPDDAKKKHERIAAWKEQAISLGLDMTGMKNAMKSLIDGGVIQEKGMMEYTDDEFAYLIEAMRQNFTPREEDHA